MKSIGVLVTGHSEVLAIPELVRRLLKKRSVYGVEVSRPIRKAESKILKRGDDTLERTVERLARQNDAVLVVLDLEDGCPAKDGPNLQARAEYVCPHKPVAVVAIYRELETWFVWDGKHLLGSTPPVDPEAKRDAKKWLRNNGMPGYNECADAPALCKQLDLEHLRVRSDSFRVFGDRVEGLVRALDQLPGAL